MYTTSASVRVKQALPQVWKCLTEGQRLTGWFAASTDLMPGTPFRFDLGDGDSFEGEVTRWEEPRRLGLRWRFMGVGPTFQIDFVLEENGDGTEVRVTDQGSRTQAGADALHEGWVDFLARLARHAETGAWARYEWSEDIGTTARVTQSRAALLRLLQAEPWWRTAFPAPRLIPADGEAEDVHVQFEDPRWEGARTIATIKVAEAPEGTYVDVSHRGWSALPPAIRVAERRRFAELWAQALRGLEHAQAGARVAAWTALRAVLPLLVAGAALQGSGCGRKATTGAPDKASVRASVPAPVHSPTQAPAQAPTVTIADVADPERDLAEVEVISKAIKATTKSGICRALLSFDFAAVTPYFTEDARIEPLFPFDEQLFADNARLRAAVVRTRAAGPAGGRQQLENDLRRLASSWSRVERCLFAPYTVFSTRGERRRAKVLLHLWLGGAEPSGGRVSDRGDVTAEMIEGKDGRWRISRMRYGERERVATRSPGFADWTNRAHLPSDWPDVGYHRDLSSGQVLYGGVATGDYDGDGWTDVYVSRAGRNVLLRNDGHGGFEDVTQKAGATVPGNGQAALFVDLDNDGDQDLVVVYAHYQVVEGPGSQRPSVAVFANDGKGKFSLRAELGPVGPASGISAADYDGDGLLDFYVTYYQDEARFPYHHRIEAKDGFGNHLFHNLGGLRFEDATERAGVGGHGWSYASAFADYDEDGKIDLYVANDFGDNYLFRNTGGGTFTEVAREARALDPANGMSVDWGDYNNDGLLDIYVSNMYSKTGREYLALDQTLDATLRKKLLFAVNGNSLYRNLGAGKFQETSRPLAVNLAGWAWGANFLDHDNDGWQDLYVANGFWEGDSDDDA